MRTTLDLDPSVLEELRERGRREGRSMGQLASELLSEALAASASPRKREPLRWRTRDLGVPRVSIEDKDALDALLDEAR